jgi:hypothetical protein
MRKPPPLPFARPSMTRRSRDHGSAERRPARPGGAESRAGAVRRPAFPAEYAGPLRPSRDVVSTTNGDRTILLHLTRQRSFTLNAVASRIWELVRERLRIPEIVGRVSEEYDIEGADAREDVVAFLAEFYDAALIECDDD